MEKKTAEDFYFKILLEADPDYFEVNVRDMLDMEDQSPEAILFRLNIKIMSEYAEQEAKAFAKWLMDNTKQEYIDLYRYNGMLHDIHYCYKQFKEQK